MNPGALPIVAIVGRPNVGKSTLFNALCRSRKALVRDEPGITRDRRYERVTLEGRTFLLVDTGGLLSDMEQAGEIEKGVVEQVKAAMDEADCLLAVYDGRAGLCEGDREMAERLRMLKKPVFHLVNKIDQEKDEDLRAEFYALGIDEPLPISAEHRRGMEDLARRIVGVLPPDPETMSEESAEAPDACINLAIIGRPNVGKSSLLNMILGKNRALVSSIAGTTRDPVDEVIEVGQTRFRIIDTAGVRKKSKTQGVEGLSAIKTLRVIVESHLVILVLDLNEGVTDQDRRIGGLAHKAGRGVLVFGNKFDLLSRDGRRLSQRQWQDMVHEQMPFLQYAPVLCGSALKGKFPREKFFQWIKRIEKARHREIPTGELNRFFDEMLKKRSFSNPSGRALKVYYVTQAMAHGEKRGNRPSTPRFVCFVNEPKQVKVSDQRFLVKQLRKKYDFFGNPIELEFRLKERGDAGLTKTKGIA